MPVLAALMFAHPRLLEMLLMSVYVQLQQSFSTHQTTSKGRARYRQFGLSGSISWMQNTCTLLRVVWSEFLTSLYDLFGADLGEKWL